MATVRIEDTNAMGLVVELGIHLGANALLALALAVPGALSPAGAAAATVVGWACSYGGGPALWGLLALFFVSSTLWSRFRRAEKQEPARLTGKTDRRDAMQVLANGAPAALCALGWRLTAEPALYVAAAAALAQANADTWCSEVGLLSGRPPRSIVTHAPVPRGRSGGVTLLGITAGVGGAALIAIALAVACQAGLAPPVPAMRALLLVWAAGFAGAILDSVLGATVQARYRTADGEYTERAKDTDGRPNQRVAGLPGLSNDRVNLACGLIVAGLAALCGLGLW